MVSTLNKEEGEKRLPRKFIRNQLAKLGKSKLRLHTQRDEALKSRPKIGPGISIADLHHCYSMKELKSHVIQHNIASTTDCNNKVCIFSPN